ncbi:transporter [Bradyrhizobium sp. WYCCWR 13022]|uniref:SphA family protein n=1 Tax=unclassified Bradyrhizobium TaxID=2631580 RepID=UPI00263B7F4C|nr:transporter [Bradyrhizobium sp. WYCCWR 13022]MDN4984889.1 transporter [Bradyrhizobium sp. WYCCWR 13022]
MGHACAQCARPSSNERSAKAARWFAALLIGTCASASTAQADEGGVSFWLPGIYGSLAALPQQPGWALNSIYYHTAVGASGSVAAARQITLGRLNPTANVSLDANLGARADLLLLNPSYTFATPVLGGQFSLGVMAIAGRNHTTLDGTITAGVGGFTTTRAGAIDSTLTGFGDLYPQMTLRWNMGNSNFMTYLTGDIPVGDYDAQRLANLGIGHGAIDGGAGYTYFNQQSGFELSAVTGLTYNLRNDATGYQNGIDWHLDWGMSQFLSKQLHVGAVGYVYNQLTADSGALPILGENKSRVAGIGPQVGYIFPIAGQQGYLNLKGYYEFGADRRPSGWNTWLTFSISPAAPTPAAPARHIVTK